MMNNLTMKMMVTFMSDMQKNFLPLTIFSKLIMLS